MKIEYTNVVVFTAAIMHQNKILQMLLHYRYQNLRYFYSLPATMKVWQTHKYGGPEDLVFSDTVCVPFISKPNDLLVQIHAASVNPIDVRMLGGYGSVAIGTLKRLCEFPQDPAEFPLTFGRDFSGVVIDTGHSVKNFKPGDEVWGAIGAQRQGTHAEFVLAADSSVSHKPKSISHVEAASIPYVATTVWSALCVVGGLRRDTAIGMRSLVFAGSGGIGTFAIQACLAYSYTGLKKCFSVLHGGAHVTTTCSTEAVHLVTQLGADEVIDYSTQNVMEELKTLKGFDIILDPIGQESADFYLSLLKSWTNSKYITIVPPFLMNTDKYGIVGGTLLSLVQASLDTAKGLKDGRSLRWALFAPSGCALKTVSQMVDNGEITPVVEKIFQFEDTPDAYRKQQEGHARGKTVISVKNTT
ncbi:NAD(P)H oxidoreductase RTN4IP1, mitochondrial-like [Tachypleus tridentatus]|uniref:NAD(P)H oxidoreductase RTN4IP1, mitochondrial-like n=1 Tax=Tachypleus tridentatus TaxID=6853 RepID=UPI003FCFEC5F